jgi:hypothetical protein
MALVLAMTDCWPNTRIGWTSKRKYEWRNDTTPINCRRTRTGLAAGHHTEMTRKRTPASRVPSDARRRSTRHHQANATYWLQTTEQFVPLLNSALQEPLLLATATPSQVPLNHDSKRLLSGKEGASEGNDDIMHLTNFRDPGNAQRGAEQRNVIWSA